MSDAADPQARQVILRAWKDEQYREDLPAEVREKLPPKPQGAETMSDQELEAAAGAGTPVIGVVLAGAALGVQVEEAWDD